MSRRITAIFIHHSVGRYIIRVGNLRARLSGTSPDGLPLFDLWDHDYNERGLSDATGKALGRAFPIPDDNTDPDGLLSMLRILKAGDSGLSELKKFDLVIMKSCYPNSKIHDDKRVDELHDIYSEIFDIVSTLDGTYVLLTSPPVCSFVTNKDEAARAREVAAWLVSTAKPGNAQVFDLFSLLSHPRGPHAGMLRTEYRWPLPWESHPNPLGSRAAAAGITKFLGNLYADKAVS